MLGARIVDVRPGEIGHPLAERSRPRAARRSPSGRSATWMTRCERAAYGPIVPSSATCSRSRVRHPAAVRRPGDGLDLDLALDPRHALQGVGEHVRA